MLVSVVIPLYNKVRYIQRAIASVLAQTYQDFELIVVDDGSTDGSGDVVRQISDPRVRLVVQENAGECAARNRGILEAHCELTAFLDADDEWLPSFLETVMGLRGRHPEAGIYATAYRLSRDNDNWRPNFMECPGSPQGGLLRDYFHAALGPPPVCSSAVMIPKCVLEEIGGFPVGIRRGGDLRTWAAIALRYPVAWSPVDGAIYQQDASNRACLSYSLLAADVTPALLIEEFLASGREPIASRLYMSEYLMRLRLCDAREHLSCGRRAWARELVRKTQTSVLFKKRRRQLQLMLLCPSWMLAVWANCRICRNV